MTYEMIGRATVLLGAALLGLMATGAVYFATAKPLAGETITKRQRAVYLFFGAGWLWLASLLVAWAIA